MIPALPLSFEHGRIVIKLASALENWLTDPSAYLGTETGVIVEHNPDRVRGPDVLYVSGERMKARPNPENSWLEVEPDLVSSPTW
ncbi:MAG: hypothetical protein C4332_13925 [Meiothermus sp.]